MGAHGGPEMMRVFKANPSRKLYRAWALAAKCWMALTKKGLQNLWKPF
jgi:hypothetical protein